MKKFITIAFIAFSFCALAQERCPKDLSPLYAPEVLTANPSALPDHICAGESVHLLPLQDGSNQNYTYTWTSDPPGFTSSLPEPEVRPLVTTVYTVVINDGTSTVSGNVTVTVNSTPVINLVPASNPKIRVISNNEISLCPFDSVTLDAGNPGCQYRWSNGSTSRQLKVATSGIAYDERDYELTVTDPVSGCSSSSTMKVTFTFADCVYGMEDISNETAVHIYPNPSSDGLFTAELNNFKSNVLVEIYNSTGQITKKESVNLFESTRFVIDLKGQSPGVYMIKVSDDRSSSVQKLIIR